LASPSLTPIPTLTPSPTPVESPTIDIATLAQNYLAAETETTDEYNALWAEYEKQRTWSQFHALYAGYADSEQSFMMALGAQVFPDSMQADLQEVFGTTYSERAIDLQLSTVHADADASPLIKDLEAAWAAASKARSQLRADLGLPPIQEATAPTFALPAPTPVPTPQWQDVTNAYVQSVNNTYTSSVLDPLYQVDEMDNCGPGMTAEQCYAGHEEVQELLDPSKVALEAHLAFMNSHPAAPCFRAAYAADRAVANDLIGWINSAGPLNGTGEGRTQSQYLDIYNAELDTFESNFNGYFSDCQ
jgi:hypothetical protein